MRPTAQVQSSLQMPLNHILGTEVNVRILRVLSGTTEALQKSNIAALALLNRAGAGRAIDKLTELGIIESIGAFSNRSYKLNHSHPLAGTLTTLFESEQKNFETLVQELEDTTQSLTPKPKAAWITGTIARGIDAPRDVLDIWLLANSKQIDRTTEKMRNLITGIEKKYDITISVHGISNTDLECMRQNEVDEIIPLTKKTPAILKTVHFSLIPHSKSVSIHDTKDSLSLRLGIAIANKLHNNPAIRDRAKQYIESRLQKASPNECKELFAWRRILETMSIPRLKHFLTDTSERSTRLRQSLPFLGALTQEEITAIRNTAP